MRGIGRSGFGIGILLVAIVITMGSSRSGGSFAGGIPAGGGSGQLVLLVVVVLGIAVLATKYVSDRPSQSPSDTNGTDDTEEVLETLKGRYVAGEIDEIEFERKLEMLFETETVADAERRTETQSVSGEQRPPEESESASGERSPPRSDWPSKRPRPKSRRGHCK